MASACACNAGRWASSGSGWGVITRLTWGGLRYESIGDHAELKAGRWLYHRIGICHVLHRGDKLIASRLGRQVFILGHRIW